MSEVENQGIAQNDGIKEVIYQIFDSVIPAETGNVAFGINDFQEIGENFRQMVDMAINEHDEAVSTYINGRIESLNTANNELHVQLIEKDSEIQSLKDREDVLRSGLAACEMDLRELKLNNQEAEEKVSALDKLIVHRDAEINNYKDQLKAKDEQIAKLTEEINKPKASIILPNQSKPSATLAQMMEEARNKTVKSQMDLALTGQTFRGKVELTVPPVGGSNDSLSFLDEDSQPIIENDRISVPETPSVDFREEEKINTFGLDMDRNETVRSDDAPATLGELKALEARIVQLEQSQRSVA